MTFGTPKKDGSGRGIRLNIGRGGCEVTEEEGKGMKMLRIEKWDDEFYSGDWNR